MKSLTLIFIAFFTTLILQAQPSVYPANQLKNIDGNRVATETLFKSGQPTVIIFADLADGKCCERLRNIGEIWNESFNDQKVRLIVICSDRHGCQNSIKPFLAARNLNFEVYLDVNNSLNREMAVNKVPVSFLVDDTSQVVYRHEGNLTDEEMIFKAEIEQLLGIKKTQKPYINHNEEPFMTPLSIY